MTSAAREASLPRLSDGADATLRTVVPEGICRAFRVLPYAQHEGRVLVAAADADDEITAHVVAERVGRPVVLVTHRVAEIVDAVDAAYPPVTAEVETPHARRAREQMTQLLVADRAVTPAQLQDALAEYSRTGDPLGEILVASGAIDEGVLVDALARLHGLPRAELSGVVPDPGLVDLLPEHLTRTLQAVPIAEHDGDVVLAVARPLTGDARAAVAQALGRPFQQRLAHRADLARLVQQVRSTRYAEVATTHLVEHRPDQSARTVVTPAQRTTLYVLAALAVVSAVLAPATTAVALVALASAAYLAVAAYRLRLTLHALGTRLETDVTDEEIAALDERTLPVYTILVPLYQEAAIVPRLVRDLHALDYPRTRLDVKLLCEADDVATIAAVERLGLPPHLQLVVVPDTEPKTKPKACNYGLQLATGDLVVIFDAEDRPDPDQLKKAVVAFDRAPDEVVCVQGKLNYFNQHQNLLTSWFSNEYAMQFELVLPAMGAAGAPIPLGGTSNHFRTSVLRDIGAWDPFNVTEDADLGIRLHRAGHRTAMIDSTTLEEANSDLRNWVRQRSRWNKGHYQTWLVHMRHPARLLREIGLRDFVSFNLTMGQAFVLLLNPVFWVVTVLGLLTQGGVVTDVYPHAALYAASVALFLGNFVFVYLNVAGSLHRGEFGLTRVALLSPVYWALMSFAAWRGFLQLFTMPFYWEKTVHGLDEVRP
ncbi:glycosyltransferase [Nocardioides sp. C4-1]|uniref:glycosyltransferase n=1 Tax=Nocardioides sp. C4-1 TaxID=3151851 RepID=UPI0032666046